MHRFIVSFALLTGAFWAASPAHAATFCATNSTELQAALDSAETNGQNDTVRVATGTYSVPFGGFVYNAMGTGGDDKDIAISGGWTEFFDNPCGQQLAEDPWLTLLDGNDAERILQVSVRANSNIDVRLLTFFDGNALSDQDEFFGKGGGIRVLTSEDYTGVMRIERNVFYHNSADIGGGLHMAGGAAGNGRMYVVNNLFISNHSRYENPEGAGASAAILTMDDGHIYVTNNTAMYNTADGNTGGFFVAYSNILLANNNLWGNDSCELKLDLPFSGDQARLYNNNIEDLCGDPPDLESGNISVEPQYEDGLLNFTPVYYSPLANSGRLPPTIGVPPFFWYLAELDLKSEARVVGPRVDIGAYESQEAELIFVNGFDPASP